MWYAFSDEICGIPPSNNNIFSTWDRTVTEQRCSAQLNPSLLLHTCYGTGRVMRRRKKRRRRRMRRIEQRLRGEPHENRNSFLNQIHQKHLFKNWKSNCIINYHLPCSTPETAITSSIDNTHNLKGDVLYKCSTCDKLFTYRSLWSRHEKEHHTRYCHVTINSHLLSFQKDSGDSGYSGLYALISIGSAKV